MLLLIFCLLLSHVYGFIEQINYFADNIISSDEYDNKNVVISPLSGFLAMKLLYNVSSEKLADELNELFHFEDRELDSLAELLHSYNEINDYNVDIVTLFMVREDVNINPSFDAILNECNGKIKKFNPNISSNELIDDLNNWIINRTNGQIQSIIQKLPSDVSALLMNAVYLDATWIKPFNENLTKKKLFYNYDGSTSEIDFMTILEKLKYNNIMNGIILEIPYKGNLSIFIITSKALPENIFNMPLKSEIITLKLPKFMIEYELDIKKFLMSKNVKSLFNKDYELPGITSESLFVTDMKQKVRINVYENGTKASGVTVAFFSSRSLDLSLEITIDHPFFFYIRDKINNINLFSGKVNKL